MPNYDSHYDHSRSSYGGFSGPLFSAEKLRTQDAASTLAVIERPIGNENAQTVDARALHAYLESGRQFSHWIGDRIDQCQFVENVDYVTFSQFCLKGRPSQEYALRLDAAKEIAMLEHNERGREARAYFIRCERQLRLELERKASATSIDLNDPRQLRAILGSYAERNIALEEKIERDAPKVQTFEDLVEAKGGMLVRVAAKELTPTTGEHRLYDWMRSCGIIIPGTTEPYQEHRDREYFVLVPGTFTKADGSTHVRNTTYVTAKGLIWLQRRWKKYHAEQGGAA